MREILMTEAEAGQRLDRLLEKYMKEAPRSFLYKMLRKKNITLNGKKADGSEKLAAGDCVRLWFSEETLDKFCGGLPVYGSSAGGNAAVRSGQDTGEGRMIREGQAAREGRATREGQAAREGRGTREGQAAREGRGTPEDRPAVEPEQWPYEPLDIIYEDKHVLLVNKPAGMLSQKAQPQDVSLVEYVIGYLLRSGQISEDTLRFRRPSVCNRLDRNTSGLVVCGKTIAGLQKMSEMFRERTMKKFYHCIVAGEMREPAWLDGYLLKDEKTNQVKVTESPVPGAQQIVTWYRPLWTGVLTDIGIPVSFLEVELITGRSHQIRAHLASIAHPIAGDTKYGGVFTAAGNTKGGRGFETVEAKSSFSSLNKHGRDYGIRGREGIHMRDTRPVREGARFQNSGRIQDGQADRLNDYLRRTFGVKSQLLHCARLEMPELSGELSVLSGRVFIAPDPEIFHRIEKKTDRQYPGSCDSMTESCGTDTLNDIPEDISNEMVSDRSKDIPGGTPDSSLNGKAGEGASAHGSR